MSLARAAAVLGLVVWALYANSLSGGFVVDNHLLLLEDPRLQSVSAANVRAIFTQDYFSPSLVTGVYRPLTTLSYFFNHAVLGNAGRPAGYHVVNILLHWGNAVLVWALARALIGDRGIALWTAALFASHPIATEAVTNIVGRADLLAAFFVLAGLLVHVRSSSSTGWRWVLGLVGLALATSAGILCKENAIALVAVVGLYDALYRRPRMPGAVLPTYLAMGLPLLAVWYARRVLYASLSAPVAPVVDNPMLMADFWTARATALHVVARYAWLLVWPAHLSCDYSYDQIPLVTSQYGTVLLGLAVLVGLTVGAVRRRRTNRALAFFIGFSLATFLPTSNLLLVIGSIMAERFLYLPSVGLAACAAMLVWRPSARRSRLVGGMILVAIVLAGGLRTIARNRDWQDGIRIWSTARAISPRSFKTHQALAYELYASDEALGHKIDAVIAESEAAFRILEARPLPLGGEPSAVPMNLGIYYWTKATIGPADKPIRTWTEKAMTALERAVELDRAENDENRRLEVLRGKPADAVADVGTWKIYYYLGLVAGQLERYQQAIEAYTYLRHLWPRYSDAYLSMARVQRAAGHPEDAAVTALQVLALEPANQAARALLVELYDQIDAEGCALVGAQNGRRLNPTCPRVRTDVCSAYTGLATVFRDAKQAPSAEEFTQRAARDHCS